MSKFKELINGEIPVLVDFYADWCGPCQTMAPVIKDVKSHFGEKIRVVKVDVDNNQEAAKKYKIRGVPTFLLFKKGEILWRAAGIHSRADLKGVIENALNK